METTPVQQASRSRWHWAVWLGAVVIVLGLGFFFLSDFQLGQDDPFAAYERAMKADKVGGATPQETLNLFIVALREGDADKAASYFLLDENGSREAWFEALKQAKDEGGFEEIADQLELVEPDPEDSIHEGDFKFVLRNNGVVERSVNMELNTYSNVWKIESL